METLKGTVKRVIYKNEDTGFHIISFQINNFDGWDSRVVVKGTFFPIAEDDELTIYGEYADDPKYGRQFNCETYEVNLPTDAKSIEKYLAAGMIKGIGPARAKKIVKQFKDDTMRVIEEEPELLTLIPGITDKTVARIRESMTERLGQQRVMIQLCGLGVTLGLAQKLWKNYKEKTLHVIQSDPYKLIDDVWGVGFSKADDIALKQGMSRTAPKRIQAGIVYTLKTNRSSGSLYMMLPDVIRKSAEVLKIDETKVAQEVQNMDGHRLTIMGRDNDHVYLDKDYRIERETEEDIIRISKAKIVPKKLDKTLSKLDSTLDEVQMGAVRTAAGSALMVLTGGPGTGKTTTVNTIIRYFELSGKSVALAAPTGRAAKRMMEATGREARTLHRLLELGRSEDGDMGYGKNDGDPIDADVVIVDETSMMDIYIAHALFDAIETGTQVILVGDKNQLPSVGPGNVLDDIIMSGICPVVELKKIYRQAEGSFIIENAHRILAGHALNLTNKTSDFFFKECDDPQKLQELLVHYVADSLPGFTGESEIQVLSPVRKRQLGVDNLNKVLQDRLNPRRDGEPVAKNGFRIGDRVIQTVNDYNREKVSTRDPRKKELGVFNGDLGTVTAIDQEDEKVTIEFEDGWAATYEYSELEALSLSYALTIHKSQGSEFPVVVIPVYDYIPMLTSMNLLYTGVTRAKKAILLIGSKKVLYNMIRNVKPTKRYSGLLKHVGQ